MIYFQKMLQCNITVLIEFELSRLSMRTPCVTLLRIRVLAGSQANGAIKPDDLAIEHIVFKNMLGQLGVVLRRSQA